MSERTIELNDIYSFNLEKLFILLFNIFLVAIFLLLMNKNYYSAIWATVACCNSSTLLLAVKHKKQIEGLKKELDSLKQEISRR